MGALKNSIAAAALLLAPIASASATTVTFSQSFGPTPTDFEMGPFSLNGFDSSLGTLTGVLIAYSYTASMSGSVTNTSASSQSFSIDSITDLIFDFSGAYTESVFAEVGHAQDYTDLASGASAPFDPYTGTDGNTITPMTIADFIGNPLVFSLTSLTGTTIIGGGGNIGTTIATEGGGFASVTYTYDEAIAAVPEPASWAMMIGGFGMMGGVLRRRRSAMVTFG